MSGWTKLFDDAPTRRLDQGETLFGRGDPVRSMYLVRSGKIALERPLADGNALTLHVACQGMVLAEASLFAGDYHCDAVIRQMAVVAVLPCKAVLGSLEASPVSALDLIGAYAHEVQSLRARVEILRLRRVSDRLDAWLDLYGTPSQGEWIRVADMIGVSPPALYRELARRRGA